MRFLWFVSCGLVVLCAAAAPTPGPGYFSSSTKSVTSLPRDLAIVAVNTTTLRSAPAADASPIEGLAYGTELRVLGRRAEWLNVKATDQRSGWVLASGVVTSP